MPEQDTEGTQAQGTSGEQPPEQPQRPEWLPEKFASEEQMGKAYNELEPKLSQVSETLANAKKELEGFGYTVNDAGNIVPMQQSQGPAPQNYQPPDQTQYGDQFDNRPIEEQVAQLRQEVQGAQQLASGAIRQLGANQKDSLVQSMPENLQVRTAALWQEATQRVPPEALLNPDHIQTIQDAVRGRAYREAAEGGGAPADTPRSPVTTQPAGVRSLGQVPTVERPSGENVVARPTQPVGVQAEVRKGLGQAIKDVGIDMTEEDWEKETAALAQERGQAQESEKS